MTEVAVALAETPTLVDACKPGEVLDGRYRLVYRIGRGGFGDVYRAEELLPDGAPFRNVALKLLLTPAADTTHWAEEAKLLASFRHPSLVTIYAAGILGTEPPLRFVSMELLEGQNLSDRLRERGRVPWRRVLRWAMSAASALDVIHLGGVVHLDLKPANLFLCDDGALKVLDFGIARRAGVRRSRGKRSARGEGRDPPAAEEAPRIEQRALQDEALADTMGMFPETKPMPGRPASGQRGGDEARPPPATFVRLDRARGTATVAPRDNREQMVIGTPGFMAPEIFELAEPTAAADAYALAVCIVQLCTGHLPYAAADEPTAWDDPSAVSAWLIAIRRATLKGELCDFASNPEVCPRGLAALVHKLLAVDPTNRGVTAGKLGELFEEVWQRPHGVPDRPYLGFTPFPAEAEGVLLGRDDDIGRLGRELEFAPFLVLHGVRGCGKSSLVSAGLIPYLGRRAADGKDDWRAVRVVPGPLPDAALADALAAISPALRDASATELAAHCEAAKAGIVLVVDPLEDVLVAPIAECARLPALIAKIAELARSPGLRLIAVLAEEHTAALLATPLGVSLRASLRYVGGPSVAAVADIVSGPARFAGASVVGIDGVVGEVESELRTSAFRLPHVALALRALWEATSPSPSLPLPEGRGREQLSKGNLPLSLKGEGAGGVRSAALDGERFRELGGVRGVLARHADRVLADLRPEERAIATELMLRLSATDGTPLVWKTSELVDTLGEGEVHALAERVLDVLARSHLVRRERGSVEIGHEALLTSFPHLTSARLHQMDRLLFLERVRQAAEAWERADNHPDFLLHGALLEELLRRRGSRVAGLLPRERAFVERSLVRRRFQRMKKVAFGAITALVLAFAVAANRMIDNAREAEARVRNAAIELERTAELAAKSRRTDNPYFRAAYLVAAMERGSTDGMLPLDLASVASGLSRVDLLTLDQVTGASFYWDDRWVVGKSSDETLTLVDFQPKEPEVIEDIDIDVDFTTAQDAHFRMPVVTEIRPHDGAIVERVPFAFDTSFVTRSATGEVKVIRLRRDGTPVIAATAPFRCAGAIQLAEAAPVLACATDEGITRWDLRKARPDSAAPEAVARHRFAGTVAAVSADGARVAATLDRRVLLWAPDERQEAVYTAEEPVMLARWSPRDDVLAVIGRQGFAAVDFSRVNATAEQGDAAVIHAPLIRGSTTVLSSSVRWDEGGVDLGICDANNVGRWFYLKRGGRAKEDPAPQGSPCGPERPDGQPEQLRGRASWDELAGKDLGPYYASIGGFKLKGHRYLSPGLALFDARAPAASPLLHFQGLDELGGVEEHRSQDSVVAVEREPGVATFQIGSALHFYTLPEGHRLFVRPGNLLRRCSDGRLAAWLSVENAFQVIDAWTGALLGVARREPAFIVGADSACKVLYTQRVDGTLLATTLASDGDGASRRLVVADGYVYDARPSPGRGPVGPGLWLALSSGAIARIDEQSGSVRLAGYASPRASAIGEGARPGEVAYVDASGVYVRDLAGRSELVLSATGESPWEDLSVAPDGASMLLASTDRIAALDLTRREIVGWMPIDGKGRLSRWDDDGSVIAWSFDRAGGAEGQVIPRGVPLAKQIARAVSNLAVDKGRLVIRR